MARPTYDNIAEWMTLISEASPILTLITSSIEAERALNEEIWADEMTLDEWNATLKALTAFVVRLQINLACYPLGFVTTVLFDEDGNPV